MNRAIHLTVKTAFSVWEQRIAPLFDTARRIHLVETDGGKITRELTCGMDGASAEQRIEWLAERAVELLVCGAVSRPLQERLAAAGIQTVPFVAGELCDVVRAWQAGTLHTTAFTMPGCCGRHRRRRGCCRENA